MKKNLKELENRKQELIEKLSNPNIGTETDRVSDISRELGRIEKEIAKAKQAQGKHTGHAVLEIYAGAGGVDAQDWAKMLLEMYQTWAEQQGYKTEVMDVSYGEQDGIKSATERIEGKDAYQQLKSESGVHRLVRQSPFSSKGIRHTSFAMVEVLPEMEELHDIKIPESDLRVDTYRASGAGGQHVNRRESAVRVTHLPTKLSTASQSSRTQNANREAAIRHLKTKLLKLKEQQQAEHLEELKPAGSPEWGNQIRSYVMHPYKQVKDHRTGVEVSQVEEVLEGHLKPFLNSE